MKKIIVSSLLAASVVLANDYTYEITPMVGYVDTKEHVDIEDHAVVGIGVARNLADKYILDKLELGLLQSGSADYDNSSKDTKITLFSLNAIEDYKLTEEFKLYALAGLGYEYISNSQFNNESDPFFNYGVGAAYSFPNDFSLKLDVRHALKFDGDKNVIYTLGLAIPFGSTTAQIEDLDSDMDGVLDSQDSCPTTQEGVEVNASGCAIDLDSDNDGVEDEFDQCPTTKEGVAVDENGCEKDSDSDGVLDSLDQCPTTAPGAKVDSKGCEILNTPEDLGIVFATDSAKIQESDMVKFEKYAKFLQSVPSANILIEAHTDSVGNAQYNQQLSQRRAQSAKALLISMGVDENRITAIGYGETKPLVSNDTAANQAKNRRVTAQIEE